MFRWLGPASAKQNDMRSITVRDKSGIFGMDVVDLGVNYTCSCLRSKTGLFFFVYLTFMEGQVISFGHSKGRNTQVVS